MLPRPIKVWGSGHGLSTQRIPLSALAPDSRLEEQGNNETVFWVTEWRIVYAVPLCRALPVLVIRCTGLVLVTLRDAA